MLDFLTRITGGKLRSYLFAGVGVLAVCGIATTIASGWLVASQRQTIAAKQEQIELEEERAKQLAATLHQQMIAHRMEQQATRELQDRLAAIEASSIQTADRLKELEATNEQVRDYLRQPLPDDLQRLLND